MKYSDFEFKGKHRASGYVNVHTGYLWWKQVRRMEVFYTWEGGWRCAQTGCLFAGLRPLVLAAKYREDGEVDVKRPPPPKPPPAKRK